jgi:hypothetical protein
MKTDLLQRVQKEDQATHKFSCSPKKKLKKNIPEL